MVYKNRRNKLSSPVSLKQMEYIGLIYNCSAPSVLNAPDALSPKIFGEILGPALQFILVPYTPNSVSAAWAPPQIRWIAGRACSAAQTRSCTDLRGILLRKKGRKKSDVGVALLKF